MSSLAAESWTWYGVTWVIVLARLYDPHAYERRLASVANDCEGSREDYCVALGGNCRWMMR